ncbi:MAG: lytic transglycosylase domain-containing protein [Acidobacteria bacterium]|nr:lytic transglycosylase domain-containing protein [Acidobacteriota bacterium]
MHICLQGAGRVLVALAMAGALPGANFASAPADGRVTLKVRADRRTGRLVQSVTATPAITTRVIEPRVVEAVAVEARVVEAPVVATKPSARPGAEQAGTLSQFIDHTAAAYDVDPLLVHSMIRAESNYNPHAISHRGAQGIMQLMPATARRFDVRNVWDARQNIEGGIRYIRFLNTLFTDKRLVVAAYNAGEGAVQRYGWIPPYAETYEYVRRVNNFYAQAKKQAATQVAQSAPPAEPVRRITEFTDSEGRVHLVMQ